MITAEPWLLLLACGAGPAPPQHAPGGPADSLDALADAYVAALSQAERTGCTWAHDSGTLRCPDGSRHDLRGMWAVVQADPDPPARAAAILAAVASPTLPRDWATARPWIRLRVCDAPLGADWPLHPDVPDGLHWCVEAALPGGTSPVAPTWVAAWGADRSTLTRAATDNLRAIDPEPFWPLSDTAARARVGDGQDADRLLLAPQGRDHAVLVVGGSLAVADTPDDPALQALATPLQAEGATVRRLTRDARGWRERESAATPARE